MCQRFVERARKRHAAAVKKAQSKFEAELQEGLDRLKRLREEAAASHTSSMRVDLQTKCSQCDCGITFRSSKRKRNRECVALLKKKSYRPQSMFWQKRKSTSCGSQCRICRESVIF